MRKHIKNQVFVQEYYEKLQTRVAELPSTVFVLAAPDFAFGDVLTE